jgi:hypothetical protein
MRFHHALAAFVLAAVSCFASEVDGKWAGKIITGEREVPMSFDLKYAEGKVTGTAVGPQGEVPVHAGLYSDGKLAFQLRYRVYDRDVVFTYEGVVKEDEIHMKLMYGVHDPVPFVVKRQK